jgi:transcriptional regulator with XRE-family HTH domain
MEKINDRVRILRKNLGLTLEKFGNRLGVGKNAISRIETGKNGVTDQMIKSICREFNVDYIWLTTGEGEMFQDSDDAFLEQIDRIMAGENELHKTILKGAASLDIEDLEVIDRIIQKFKKIREEKP